MTNHTNRSKRRASHIWLVFGTMLLASAGQESFADELKKSNVLGSFTGPSWATVSVVQDGAGVVQFTVTPHNNTGVYTQPLGANFGVRKFTFNTVSGCTITANDITIVSPSAGNTIIATPPGDPFGSFAWEITCGVGANPLIFTVAQTGISPNSFQQANANKATYSAEIGGFTVSNPAITSQWVSEAGAIFIERAPHPPTKSRPFVDQLTKSNVLPQSTSPSYATVSLTQKATNVVEFTVTANHSANYKSTGANFGITKFSFDTKLALSPGDFTFITPSSGCNKTQNPPLAAFGQFDWMVTTSSGAPTLVFEVTHSGATLSSFEVPNPNKAMYAAFIGGFTVTNSTITSQWVSEAVAVVSREKPIGRKTTLLTKERSGFDYVGNGPIQVERTDSPVTLGNQFELASRILADPEPGNLEVRPFWRLERDGVIGRRAAKGQDLGRAFRFSGRGAE